ncbi:MAG: hypothetical protein ABI402_11410 [Ferruginibacter sp.]
MYPRDLFKIIIKVFGLFIIKDIFMTIPYLFTPLLAYMQGENYGTGMLGIILPLVTLGFYFFVAYMFIFRTASMVDFLKLEQDFLDEPISFHISSRNVVVISLILLSGYILVEEIPDFCNSAFNYYQQMQVKYAAVKPSIARMVISGVKIFLAFLIIGERSRIIELVLKDNTAREEI